MAWKEELVEIQMDSICLLIGRDGVCATVLHSCRLIIYICERDAIWWESDHSEMERMDGWMDRDLIEFCFCPVVEK